MSLRDCLFSADEHGDHYHNVISNGIKGGWGYQVIKMKVLQQIIKIQSLKNDDFGTRSKRRFLSTSSSRRLGQLFNV